MTLVLVVDDVRALAEQYAYDLGRLGEFETATEPRQDVAFFFNNLGVALERGGYLTASAEAFRTALALDEDYERATVNLVGVDVQEIDPV